MQNPIWKSPRFQDCLKPAAYSSLCKYILLGSSGWLFPPASEEIMEHFERGGNHQLEEVFVVNCLFCFFLPGGGYLTETSGGSSSSGPKNGSLDLQETFWKMVWANDIVHENCMSLWTKNYQTLRWKKILDIQCFYMHLFAKTASICLCFWHIYSYMLFFNFICRLSSFCVFHATQCYEFCIKSTRILAAIF